MKRIEKLWLLCFALSIAVAIPALAEENLIGKITVSDGGYATNYSTGYGSAGCVVGESCSQAFALSSAKLITVQCDGPAVVSISRASNDAGIGNVLTTNQFLFTDTGKLMSRGVATPDGGTYYGAVVSVAATPGSTGATCSVSSRTGLE